MAYTTFKARKTPNYNTGTQSFVSANSADFGSGTPVSIGATGAVPSTAGTTIVGVSVTAKTFASDNFTVAKDVVNYIPSEANQHYQITITGGTITIADQGKYYDLTAAAIVDGATESTTTGQVRLEKFISATLGVFSIANL